MPRGINVTKQARRFLISLDKGQSKHYRQIRKKMEELRANPYPSDSKRLVGNDRRATCGEYRIIYAADDETLNVFLIGKRNDDKVYRAYQRLLAMRQAND